MGISIGGGIVFYQVPETGNTLTTTYAVPANISSSTLTIDMQNSWNYATVNTAISQIQFINIPESGKVGSTLLEIKQDSTGGRTISGTSYVTPGGTALDISALANSTSLISFFTRDGGNTIYGINTGKNWS